MEKLSEYRRKRRFDVTPEPQGGERGRGKGARTLMYAIQKHMASRLHYDLRLEWDGVLLSWAVPRGPSPDPEVKRLAMRTEDHPLEYADFEGIIPAGEYGAGTVMLWDRGSWMPEGADVSSSLRKGEIKFTLQGEKLRGSWVLVQIRGFGEGSRKSTWLLIKHRDEYASTKDITLEEPRSVRTHRLLAEIARDDGGDVRRASQGDPPAGRRPANNAKRRPSERKNAAKRKDRGRSE